MENVEKITAAINNALKEFKLTITSMDEYNNQFQIGELVERPNYEYELLFKSEPHDPVKIDGWIPIEISRLRHPEKLDEYLAKGILRKIA